MPNIFPCCYEVVQCKHYSRIVFLLHFSNFVMHFDVVWKHVISNRDFPISLHLREPLPIDLELPTWAPLLLLLIILYWGCILTTEVYGITCYIVFATRSQLHHHAFVFFICALAACRLWSVSRGRTIWGNLLEDLAFYKLKMAIVFLFFFLTSQLVFCFVFLPWISRRSVGALNKEGPVRRHPNLIIGNKSFNIKLTSTIC